LYQQLELIKTGYTKKVKANKNSSFKTLIPKDPFGTIFASGYANHARAKIVPTLRTTNFQFDGSTGQGNGSLSK
jgi:hypothetical protein